MDYLFLLGRLLFGGFFILSGLRHFINTEALSQYASSKGLPGGRGAVYLSGLMIIVGGVGVVTGLYPVASLWLIILFLLAVTFTIHRYWQIPSPEAKAADRINFEKNLALLGAALMLLTTAGNWIYVANF